MSFLIIVVLGVFVYLKLPLEFSPEFSNAWLWLFIPFPNSNPSEVDRSIAVHFEEQLKMVRYLKRLEITSTAQGCSASMSFYPDTNMDTAYLEVRDAYERARTDFPSGVEQIQIYRNKSNDWPILWLGLSYGDDPAALYRLVEERIKPALERIDGVAQVESHGINPETLFIDLETDRLQAHGINMFDVYSTLRKANENPSVGTIEEGGSKILLRTRYRLQSEQDYQEFPLGASPLTLQDIAVIDRRMPEVNELHRINGRQGFTISVQKESSANTVEVGEKVFQVLKTIQSDPELNGLAILPFFDQAEWIQSSLTGLRSTGLWGALFAAIILFFFLRQIGATLIVLTAVPLSVLSALIGLYFIGYSLNIGSMMGLMLAIGMLVDNSVVVTENIFRLRAKGIRTEEASISGAAHVGTAITASTMTTIIVFLPLVFGKGEMGIWMKQIGIPISLSLLSSLLIALSLVPLAITRFITVTRQTSPGIIAWTTRYYLRILKWIIFHPLPSFLMVIIILLSVMFPLPRIQKNLRGGEMNREIIIRISAPENATLEETDAAVRKYEQIILEHQEELTINNVYCSIEQANGRLRLFMDDSGKDIKSEEAIKKRIRELFPKIPGVSYWFGWHGGSSSDSNVVDITLQGNSNTVLSELITEVRPCLLNAPQITDVRSDDDNPMSEITITIDKEIARINGITPEVIARTIAVGVMGQSLPRFQSSDKEISVRLQLREEDRKDVSALQNLLVYSPDGRGFPLKSLATFQTVPGQNTIIRVDGKIQKVLQIETEEKDMDSIRDTIRLALQSFRLPTGYNWTFGRSFADFDEGMAEIGQTFLLALILVILLLGALFESLLHPFTIILSLPFAMVGVYWTLFLTDTELNIMGNIGLVILIGVVVNNAIVMIDCIIQLRATGIDRTDAILQAAEDRLRPIVMTAATTILGLAPMAISSSQASSQMYSTMAITVMGGMTTSTVLTLLVIPLFYQFMDQFQITLKKLFFSLNAVFTGVLTQEDK